MKNKLGFGLIELMVVIVVIGLIALLAVQNFKGSGEDDKSVPETINEVRDTANAHSVESYAKAVEAAVVSYLIVNYNVDIPTICFGEGPASGCAIDATVAGMKDPATSTASKVVTYGGTKVVCADVKYNPKKESIEVFGCSVGDSQNTYSWQTDSMEGAIKDSQ